MIPPLAEPFLAGAREGQFMVQACPGCGNHQLPARARCARCGRTRLWWVASPGVGRVASFAVMHRGARPEDQGRVPYVYALVELGEGPRIITNVVHIAPRDVQVGMEVRVVFERRDQDDQPWPEFAPSGSA